MRLALIFLCLVATQGRVIVIRNSKIAIGNSALNWLKQILDESDDYGNKENEGGRFGMEGYDYETSYGENRERSGHKNYRGHRRPPNGSHSHESSSEENQGERGRMVGPGQEGSSEKSRGDRRGMAGPREESRSSESSSSESSSEESEEKTGHGHHRGHHHGSHSHEKSSEKNQKGDHKHGGPGIPSAEQSPVLMG